MLRGGDPQKFELWRYPTYYYYIIVINNNNNNNIFIIYCAAVDLVTDNMYYNYYFKYVVGKSHAASSISTNERYCRLLPIDSLGTKPNKCVLPIVHRNKPTSRIRRCLTVAATRLKLL